MALFRRRSQTVILTAAGSQILRPTDPESKSAAQDAEYLYGLYRDMGPIHAAMQSKFLAASKINYYPARRIDPGADPELVEDGPAVEAFTRLRGPQGEFSDFVAELAMHWEIVGEGYLVGQTVDDQEEWDVWSAVEYEKYRRRRGTEGPQDAPDDLDDDDVVYRSWRSDPMQRERPDAPLRAVRGQCEQYLLFQSMLTALGQSRLVNQLLITPSEMDFPETDENGNAQTFGSWLMKAMSAAINDPSNANRLTPITLEVPAAFKDAIDTIDLTRDMPEWIPDLMDKILRQIAIGLDIPADILTGLADVNHWSAWLIDDSLRLNYVDPLILAVLDSLTRAYLIPVLQAQNVPDAETYMFWRDYSDLTSRTVSPSDAVSLLDRGLITPEAARRAVGFTEADAPDDLPPDYSAKIESLGALIRAGFDPDESIVALGLPAIPHLGVLPVTVQSASEAAPEMAMPDMEPEPGIPVITAASSPQSFAAIDHRLYTQLSEAAQAALDRALEKAGQRVRSQIRGDSRRGPKDPLALSVDGIDPILVPLTLGRDTVEALQLSEEDLIPESAFDRFASRASRLLVNGQQETKSLVEAETGIRPEPIEEEDSWVGLAVSLLVGGLLALARRRLFTPTLEPDPSETGEVESTDVPAALIFDGLTVAGGGTVGDLTERGLATGSYGQQLVVSVGFQVRERQWNTGAPTIPFEPHQRLEGVRFEQWTSDRLATPLSAAWLGVDFMFPGDHGGCQCVTELVIEPPPELERAHMAIDPLPDYVNPRAAIDTLSSVDSTLTTSQTAAVQDAFRLLNQRWPGAVAELQEIVTTPDITAFATKSRWSIRFNQSLVGDVSVTRNNWAPFANKATPGQIATKAGGAIDDIAYMRNVALHEMSHVAEGRFRVVASVSQRQRLEELWEEINEAQRTAEFDKLPSLYATENSGEFFAEALSDVLIGDDPNPMSLRVAELFDEVFG